MKTNVQFQCDHEQEIRQIQLLKGEKEKEKTNVRNVCISIIPLKKPVKQCKF